MVMKDNNKEFIIKIILILFMVLLSFFINKLDVHAKNLPNPSSIDFYNTSGQSKSTAITTSSNWWYGYTILWNGVNTPTSNLNGVTPSTSHVQFIYRNLNNLCSDNIEIEGVASNNGLGKPIYNYSIMNYGANFVQLLGNNGQCTYTVDSNTNIHFKCVSKVKNVLALTFFFDSGDYQGSTNIGLVSPIDYHCDISNEALKDFQQEMQQNIINNQNNNANNIINNQNQNKQDIINNQNNNAQNVINNQNQNKQDIINNQNQNADKINNSLTDTSTPTGNSFLDNLPSIFDKDNNFLLQLITIPYNLYTSIRDSFNGSCKVYNVGSIKGQKIDLPCIDIKSFLGNNLYNIIDVIFCAVIGLNLINRMKEIFDSLMELNSNFVSKTGIKIFK